MVRIDICMYDLLIRLYIIMYTPYITLQYVIYHMVPYKGCSHGAVSKPADA